MGLPYLHVPLGSSPVTVVEPYSASYAVGRRCAYPRTNDQNGYTYGDIRNPLQPRYGFRNLPLRLGQVGTVQ
jgi:hypothetical protein